MGHCFLQSKEEFSLTFLLCFGKKECDREEYD